MKKHILKLICIVVLAAVCSLSVSAASDYQIGNVYETYIYNSENEPVAIPEAFEASHIITGDSLGVGGFKTLSDLCYNGDGFIFLCDGGNNRIIAVNTEWKTVALVSEFIYNGNSESFNSPQGIWADAHQVYVADTGNSRIVAFDFDGSSLRIRKIFDRPEIRALDGDYTYSPSRLTVDATGRMYVVASGVNQGLLCLDENGTFQNFLGAPQVELNIFEMLWRKIATKEQLARMESYVPTEYSAITMDSYGFLYVASKTSNSVPAGKLNSDGDNVLLEPKSKYYGDYAYLSNIDSGYMPHFSDIALFSTGRIGEDIYYLLDSNVGKIYAYTEDGYLLYAFGVNSQQRGAFANASAIEYVPSEDGSYGTLVVTDSLKGTVTVLKETDFSCRIRNALRLYNLGSYEEAEAAWRDVLNTSSGYTLATIGLAKIDLQKKNYGSAMNQLQVIREHELYSDAFSYWRDDFVRNNFVLLLLGAAAAVALIVIIKKVLRKKRGIIKRVYDSQICAGYRYGSYAMLHPFDGFWDLKHEKRGNIKSAALMYALFFAVYALRIQFGGYVVTGKVSSEANVLYNVFMLLLPIVMWIVANWCFTTLMDGKGTIKDITIATAYALKPYIIFGLPMLVLSNIMTASEVSFYNIFDAVILAWVLILLFSGLMMTHDYSFGKSIVTTVLILVGICLIIFILLLAVSIAQNVYQFIYNIYQELSFRTY